MVRFKVKVLMANKELQEGKKITYRLVAKEARVSTSILTAMSNQKMKQVGLTTIDKLCGYFGCQVGDLMEYVPNGTLPESEAGNENR